MAKKMAKKVTKASNTIMRYLLPVVFVLVLLHSLWVVSVGWGNSILDEYAFRQTQTAITVEYLLRGGHWLAYETPVMGPPWIIPFEFPLYQWLVAGLVKVFGTGIDQTGRFVSVMFFYLTLVPLWSLLGNLLGRKIRSEIRPEIIVETRWIFLSLFLVSPLYLFWSRSFMIESTAIFFSVSYVACILEFLKRRSTWSIQSIVVLLLCGGVGALGAMVKITTFFAFGLLGATVWMWKSINLKKMRMPQQLVLKKVIEKGSELAIIFGVPVICLFWWTHFADSLKHANPLADGFITSSALTTWNFGTLAQKLSWDMWYGSVFHGTMTRLVGACEAIFIYIIMSFFQRLNRVYFWGSLALFLLVPMVFTNLHMVHTYYAYGNGIFLIMALGFCLSEYMSSSVLCIRYKIGLIMFLLALGMGIRSYYYTYYERQSEDSRISDRLISAVQAVVKPDEVVMFYGDDWSSVYPYSFHRRTIMDRDNRDLSNVKIQQSLKNLAAINARLGAVVFCGPMLNNSERRAWVMATLAGLKAGAEPVYVGDSCAVFGVKG